MEHPKDPLAGPLGALCKFVAAGLCGGLVCDLLLFSAGVYGWKGLWSPPWIHLFWLIPLVWGILGIFRFSQMLDAARALFEESCR